MGKIILPLIILFLLGLACNFSGLGGGGLELKFNNAETSITPISGFVAPNSSGGHSIQLTNYEVKMGDTYDFSKISAKKDGQIRIEILILKKVAISVQPLVVGTYKPRDRKEESKDKVVRATIHQFSGNTVRNYQASTDNLTGYVKILSVNGKTVKGRIDLTDGQTKIKGEFTAQTLKY